MGKIILASSSPRRADILKNMHLNFEIVPSSYVEIHDRTDFSYDYVQKLAHNKALYVARELHEKGINTLVLGADTVVVVDNKILGKPENSSQAHSMLKTLSGRTHFVVTGVSIVSSFTLQSKKGTCTTYVTFNPLSDEQIDYYITNFKPFDKAGAYGIQELPNGYVEKVEGELDNVIGLSSKLVYKLLSEFDHNY